MRVLEPRSLLGLAGWLALCFLVAAFGARFEPGGWYEQLQKPTWNPPDWVFAPVWTTLYTLMAVAAWGVWRARGLRGAGLTLGLFLLQLFCNGLWSWLFFGQHQMGWALADVLVLDGVLLATIVAFFRIQSWTGWLLVPYLLWSGYATALNAALWTLNP
ncbi:MAG: TspO/MBR family protein [Candidatus Competibacteraceae bacterium]|nr:TspO/MBR family protein [Candidatus Competibacteraceae bacterium]